MSIESLPDGILDMMFERLPYIEDVLNCSRVCRHWWTLAQRRLKHVNYLIASTGRDDEAGRGRQFILYRANSPKGYSFQYMKILPNLKIMDIEKSLDRDSEKIFFQALESRPDIIGLAYPYFEPEDPSKNLFLRHIQMFAPGCLTLADAPVIKLCSDSLGQLFLEDNYINIDELLARCKSLERIHVHHYEGARLLNYNGIAFENLLILELDLTYFYGPDTCLNSLMDACPKLHSIFLRFTQTEYNFVPKKVNNSLENLVLEHYSRSKDPKPVPWREIPLFLEKVPNLKNFALRSCPGIKDIHIHDIINSCPSIQLIDLRGCPNISPESEKVFTQLTKSKNRHITFLLGEYPKIVLDHSDKVICQGFNFMKHIFHKSWKSIPLFLTHE